MKLSEALKLLQEPIPPDAKPLRIFLACGFEPLHLRTFLAAHLRVLNPERAVQIETGLYGDAWANLDRAQATSADAAILVLEWSDLDPRLGIRHLGGWSAKLFDDILGNVAMRLCRFRPTIENISARVPLVICLPTLPLPPIGHTPASQASLFELKLHESLSRFACQVAQSAKTRWASLRQLENRSPLAERLDVRSELSSGFPYRLTHASCLGELLARLIHVPAPRKGLITDLDDTLWRGLLGEVGVRGINWDLEHGSQIHGLYQQSLRSLAEAGTLLAVASKNDPGLVDEAFGRDDLVLSKALIYPIEAHWKPKSESVTQILRAWNVAADDVVFVDDDPTELAEVKTVHPRLTCILFPKSDNQAAYELLHHLLDLFGKETLSAEDGLRLESLRINRDFLEATSLYGAPADPFLEQLQAHLTLSFTKDPEDARSLELVNKTNQFNLNGKRYSESEWRTHLMDDRTFQLRASYKDKFGSLGKIAVLTGCLDNGTLLVETWVMSCRAFSRRIEYQCLRQLFEAFDAREITFDFQQTPRNGPLREFLISLGEDPLRPGFCLSREAFARMCPPLHHRIETAAYV